MEGVRGALESICVFQSEYSQKQNAVCDTGAASPSPDVVMLIYCIYRREGIASGLFIGAVEQQAPIPHS